MTFAITKKLDTRVLVEMLTSRRPAGSKSERRFIRQYIEPLGVTRDAAGNLYKQIGDAPVLWSCHTDTVHKMGGSQLVTLGDSMVWLGKTSLSNCLGADDTAGVWLMHQMILAERPGLYVFHRGEEIGGVGSTHIATRTPGLLAGIECAIALDRMGTTDVITHQMSRCCSDDFASALAGKLGGKYQADSGGIFTDTANYTDIVGECTNISVGYYKQHTANEYLDLAFITDLRDTLLEIDTRDLPSKRKPGEVDAFDFDYGSYETWGKPYGASATGYGDWRDYRDAYSQSRMSDIVEAFPKAVADILTAYGLTADDLMNELRDRGEIPH